MKANFDEKNLATLTGNADFHSKISPLDCLCDLTGIERDNVVNIDHFRENDQIYTKNRGISRCKRFS